MHALPNGHKVDVRPDGREIERRADGGVEHVKAPGMDAHFGASGRPDMIHTERNGIRETIRSSPGGGHVVESVRRGPDGHEFRSVSYGPRHGYVEHPVFGRPGYMRRSYMMGGRRYAVMYRGYHYRGYDFYRPIPAYFYSPAFYGWALAPWGRPVAYRWGWQAQPWFGVYGGIFVPYDEYASMDQWMTDRMLAANLQSAYEAGQVDGGQASGGYAGSAPPQITPALKTQIDAQVRTEIAEQQQIAAGGAAALGAPVEASEADQLPDALRAGHTVFRVVAPLTLQAAGEPCTLNADDWVVRTGGMDQQTGTVGIQVAASRGGDCAQSANTTVALNDLMTMQNDQNEQIVAGLKAASESMGKNGLPAGPSAGTTLVAAGQSVPDLDTQATLQQQQTNAAATEQQAMAAAGSQ